MVKIILTFLLFLISTAPFSQEIGYEYDIPYDRDLFGRWADVDRDCIDTRQEILIRDAFFFTMDAAGCRVITGMWRDYYTGLLYTDPSELDIDHLVPLKEIWDSGAIYWTTEELKDIFNNETNLIVTHKSVNRSKGSREPHEWSYFQNIINRCEFIERWFSFKINHDLTFDETEIDFIYNQSGCN